MMTLCAGEVTMAKRRPVRLALLADIHHGPDIGTKIGTAALPLLREIRGQIVDAAPDALIELGDRINDVDHDEDIRLTREVADALAGLNLRRAHLLGNHDNHEITRAEAESAFQLSFDSYSFDLEGLHIAIWNADTHVRPQIGFSFAEHDLAWLQADLARTELPTVLCTHVPLDNGSMVGNLYFEHQRQYAYYEHEGVRAREIIERSGKVILCLAGHTHWNACHSIDGVHYATIHSLTESFTTPPHPTGAWARCEIGEHIEIEVFGRDPVLYRLPIRAPGAHWSSRDKDYSPKPPALPEWQQRRRERFLRDA